MTEFCDALEEVSCATESHHPPARVLFVVDHTEKSALTARLSAILTRLQRLQVRALVVVLRDYGEATEQIQAKSVTVVSLEMPQGKAGSAVENIGAMLRLKALVKKSQPDIIQTWGPQSERLARMVAANTKTPMLATGLPEGRRGAWTRLADLALNLVCPASIRLLLDADESLLLQEIHNGREPQRLLGGGVDISRARSAIALGFEDLPPDRYYVGLPIRSGRSAVLKPMLAAFQALAAWQDNATLLVISDAAEIEMRPWIDDLGLRDRVQLRQWGAEPAALLRRLHVLWAHDRPRPNQDLMLRAMCLGIPVVCDHDTGLADDIRAIGGALMRDAAWPRQFVEATRELIENADLSLALAKAGRILVEERYNINNQAEALRAVYNEVLPASPNQSGA